MSVVENRGPRDPRLADLVLSFLHRTGIAWLTPFVGKVDGSDLEYLRACILRDLKWAESLWRESESAPPGSAEALDQVGADLAALSGWKRKWGNAESDAALKPVRYPWHAASGWTDYGAIRLALVTALPPRARRAELVELRIASAILIDDAKGKWNALADNVEGLLKAPRKNEPDRRNDPSIPHKLQVLWREIDFARNHSWQRIAKQNTISGITWSIVTATTLALAFLLPANTGDPDRWLILLFGLLGGAASSLRSVKRFERLPARRSVESEALKLRLRPVVGAMAALVVYALGRTGIVFEFVTKFDAASPSKMQILVKDIDWAYYVLAFLAGFSERMFLGVLGMAEGRVLGRPAATTEKPTEEKPTETETTTAETTTAETTEGKSTEGKSTEGKSTEGKTTEGTS